METVCTAVLIAELVRIGWVDARTRTVLLLDVVVLALMRCAFALMAFGGAFAHGSPAYLLWDPAGIVSSCAAGLAAAMFLWLIGKAVSFRSGKEALGTGDAWLCAVLPLFLDAGDVPLFLIVSATGACIEAPCASRKEGFPFALSRCIARGDRCLAALVSGEGLGKKGSPQGEPFDSGDGARGGI